MATEATIVSGTSAEFESVASTVNTVGKFDGRIGFSTDSMRLVRATGPAAADPWAHVAEPGWSGPIFSPT